MARPELHSTDGLLDAARGLVLEDGARSVTIDRLVAVSGAPKGSIYHRFSTLDDLLAAMWLRALQRSQVRSLAALEALGDEPVETAVATGLGVHDFAVAEPADARLLASMRREDLLRTVKDEAVAGGLRRANEQFKRAVLPLARALYGGAGRDAVERTLFATVDLPYGAVRRHLGTGAPIPSSVRPQLEAAIRGALDAR